MNEKFYLIYTYKTFRFLRHPIDIGMLPDNLLNDNCLFRNKLYIIK